MAVELPRLFVGSSSEKREVASVVHAYLKDIADVDVWDKSNSFKQSESILSGLLRAAGEYHFGVFILTPDDVTLSRDITQFSARDNVLFEYGLFLGALGPERTLALVERGDDKVKVPSDLLGIKIEPFTFTSVNNLRSQIGPALDSFRETIKNLGPLSFSLRGGWEFDGDTQAFKLEISPIKLNRYREKIASRKLLLVIRKHDPLCADQEDKNVIIGVPRSVGRREQEIALETGSTGCLGQLEKGDKVNGFLYLVPEKADISGCKCMKDLEDLGCVLLDYDFGVEMDE